MRCIVAALLASGAAYAWLEIEAPAESLAGCAPVGWQWFFLQTVFILITMGGVIMVIDLLRDRKLITAAVHAAVTAERQRCLLLVEVAE